jgi:hypothetical protein
METHLKKRLADTPEARFHATMPLLVSKDETRRFPDSRHRLTTSEKADCENCRGTDLYGRRGFGAEAGRP